MVIKTQYDKRAKFQVLIGRLVTEKSASTNVCPGRGFQVLIGRLVTGRGGGPRRTLFGVSSPYR